MKPEKFICAAIIAFACACAIGSSCSPTQTAGGGTRGGNPVVVGLLHATDGITPETGAKVYLIPVDYNPRPDLGNQQVVGPESTITNENGYYKFDSVPVGLYNIIASAKGNLAFDDVMIVTSDTLHVSAIALEAPGGLKGRVRLQAGDDARSVTMLFMGTITWIAPYDSTGTFAVPEMAEGAYWVRIFSTLTGYFPKDTVLSVTSGTVDSLSEDIVLRKQ
jgi:hypothetical protein